MCRLMSSLEKFPEEMIAVSGGKPHLAKVALASFLRFCVFLNFYPFLRYLNLWIGVQIFLCFLVLICGPNRLVPTIRFSELPDLHLEGEWDYWHLLWCNFFFLPGFPFCVK